MELSYDSSEWVSDDDGHQSARLAVSKPKPKRMCQVPGCTADLEAIGKLYCSVKRICPFHMKADIIPVRNQIMRYCQQCGVLEPLSLFDFTKRSCRDSLSRRVKHPVESETRPKRKRKTHHDSDAGSNSGYWPSPYAWTATGSAGATAAAGFGGVLTEVSWDAAHLAAAGPLLVNSGLTSGDATAWGSTAAGVLIPNSCWLELSAAEEPAAAAAAPWDGSSLAALVSPASSSCTAAAAAAAAAPPSTSGGVAAMMVRTGNFGFSELATAMIRQTFMQQPLQPISMQGLPAAAGINSPLSGSNGSCNELGDAAVLELEQFMMQELAAAGMMVNDSSSATPLPTVPAAPTPAPQQPIWHQAPMPQQQQQQQASGVNAVMQYQQLQPMQLQQPFQQPLQQPLQQQACGTRAPAHHHWRNPAATTAGGMAACYAPSAAPAAAAGVWVPVGACGSNMPSPSAGNAPQLQLQQQQVTMRASPGPSSARSGPPSAADGRGSSTRSEMMARLQGRLHVLQSQMEDMQLMLGLLQDG